MYNSILYYLPFERLSFHNLFQNSHQLGLYHSFLNYLPQPTSHYHEGNREESWKFMRILLPKGFELFYVLIYNILKVHTVNRREYSTIYVVLLSLFSTNKQLYHYSSLKKEIMNAFLNEVLPQPIFIFSNFDFTHLTIYFSTLELLYQLLVGRPMRRYRRQHRRRI